MGAAVNAGPAYVGKSVVRWWTSPRSATASTPRRVCSKRPREGSCSSRPESQTISWRMGRDGSRRYAARDRPIEAFVLTT